VIKVRSTARGRPADLGAIADAITGLSRLACDRGGQSEALDINPLICGPSGAVAADVPVMPRALPSAAGASPQAEPGADPRPAATARIMEEGGLA
jgi:hypothetical protein